MNLIRRIGRCIFSPCWYLFAGILWVFFLNTYASNSKNLFPHWVFLHKNLTWHDYCVFSAIGLCFVACLLALLADCNKKKKFLRCKYAAMAILGSSASALLMVGGYVPRFVFSSFIIVLVSLGIVFFRDKVRTSDPATIKEVRRWSLSFLTFVGVILSAFFVVLLVDVREFEANFLEMLKTYFTTATNIPKELAGNFLAYYESTTAPIIVQKATFSVFGLIAYILIGCGITTWEVFVSPNED